MAIVFDNAVGQEFSAATTYTVVGFSVSGSNTYGLVGIGLRSNTADITSVTFNGVSMSLLKKLNKSASSMTTWVYGLAGPTTGNIVINGDTSLAAEVCVVTYTGVHQTTSYGTIATATGDSAAPSVDVTSATDEMVVDFVGWNAGGDGTAGASQTKRAEGQTGNGISMDLATSEEAGAATTTMSWSINSGGGWLTTGIPLKPVGAGGGSSLLPLLGVG